MYKHVFGNLARLGNVTFTGIDTGRVQKDGGKKKKFGNTEDEMCNKSSRCTSSGRGQNGQLFRSNVHHENKPQELKSGLQQSEKEGRKPQSLGQKNLKERSVQKMKKVRLSRACKLRRSRAVRSTVHMTSLSVDVELSCGNSASSTRRVRELWESAGHSMEALLKWRHRKSDKSASMPEPSATTRRPDSMFIKDEDEKDEEEATAYEDRLQKKVDQVHSACRAILTRRRSAPTVSDYNDNAIAKLRRRRRFQHQTTAVRSCFCRCCCCIRRSGEESVANGLAQLASCNSFKGSMANDARLPGRVAGPGYGGKLLTERNKISLSFENFHQVLGVRATMCSQQKHHANQTEGEERNLHSDHQCCIVSLSSGHELHNAVQGAIAHCKQSYSIIHST
ncbi:hypothetical protein KP509_02G085000 [Ceratopteris richardii]|uniref:Uncharacterized protein n=1 Tax=Ceratopteris richardii TaxID=49495 RepID=A0A8T2VF22_CERRI|nr:hypothetical protein KP509_02G085000 [Ceratopteris richardii]